MEGKVKNTKVLLVLFHNDMRYSAYIDKFKEELKVNKNISILTYFLQIGSKARNKNEIVSPGEYGRKLYTTFWKLVSKKYLGLEFFEIWCLRNNIDVIHILHSFTFKHVSRLLLKPASERPKVVFTLRGGDTYIKPWIDERYRSFFANYGSHVDAFICQSNNHKEYLGKWCVNGFNAEVITVGFGAPKGLKKPATSLKKIKVVSVFRVTWEKNIVGNLMVIKELINRGVDVSYDIYGGGQHEGQIPYLIDKLGLSEVTKYHGFIPSKELDEKLGEYDIYLQLSLSESAGASVLEAESHGVPVVVSDSGGLPEMIVDGKTGYVVPFYDYSQAADKIEWLQANLEVYNEFSQSAMNYVNENYTSELEARKTMQLYQKLTNV